MEASAVDILDRVPSLDLTDYSHIEIPTHDGGYITVELRDGHLTLRSVGRYRGDRMTVRPITANQIEIDLGEPL